MTEIRWTPLRVAALVALVALSGCANQLTQAEAKKEATGRWNVARSRVKAQLAADQLAAGNVSEAADQVEKALSLDPTNPRLMVLSAKVALARGDDRLAEQLLQAIVGEPPVRAEAEYLLGVIAQQRLNSKDALEHFVRAAALDAGELAYPIAVAQALLDAGDPQAALDQLDRRRAEIGWTSAYHAARAECLEALGEWRAAAGAWREAASGTKDAVVQERLALALRQCGAWKPAADALESRLCDEPGTARLLRLALAECRIECRDFEPAREQIARVLRADARDAEAWLLLARIEMYEGRFEKALDFAQRARSYDQTSRGALETVAGLATHLGRRDIAESALAQLKTLDPQNPVAAAIATATSAATAAPDATLPDAPTVDAPTVDAPTVDAPADAP